MKKYVILIVLTMLFGNMHSQDLISKYKTGKVKLVPDTEYASGNDWSKVFRSYYDTIYDSPMGMRKSLVILPDGSVVVNHGYRDYHTKFSPSGNFEKEFIMEKAGHNPIMGVLNGNTLFTGLDQTGKLTCSDLDGKFKKTLLLDYMAYDILALNNGKFAVLGWVIWSEKTRTFVSIVDYNTNEEKVIWEQFNNREFSSVGKKISEREPFKYSIVSDNGQIITFSSMPYSKASNMNVTPKIASVNNDLIIANPNTGEIMIYDLEGNLKSTKKIDWPNSYISVEEQKIIQQKAIDRYKKYFTEGNEKVTKNQDAYNQMISEMTSDLNGINSPLSIPSFSNIIKDSDGNVLFFEIPEKEGANVFHVWVFTNGGKFETKCTFECDDFQLNISPSKMVFYNGYIYSLQLLKEATGNPLRLVRFKIN